MTFTLNVLEQQKEHSVFLHLRMIRLKFKLI